MHLHQVIGELVNSLGAVGTASQCDFFHYETSEEWCDVRLRVPSTSVPLVLEAVDD